MHPSSFLHKPPVFISHSPQETKAYGKQFMQKILQEGKRIVAFYGDLGAGKTLFIKGMASYLDLPEKDIVSPTFTYLNIYPSSPALYHFDLYRIEKEKTFVELGFQEYLDQNQLCLIEWAERIPSLLPNSAVKVTISHLDESKREILIQP